MANVPGAKLVTTGGTLLLIIVIGLVLFGPPGMAGDLLVWLGGKIGAFFGDLLNRLPDDNASALEALQ